MFTPLILFLGLLIATAVIAYWSDNLGKKLGKKRVSLLGMRPRTTATFLTITSSWAIMVFTLAALLAVAAPLRFALFRYEAERTQYQEDIFKAEKRLEDAATRLKSTQTSLDDKQKSLHVAQENVKGEQENTRKAQADRRKAEAERRKAEAARKRAEVGRKNAQDSLKNAQAGVAQAQGKVAAAQNQFEAAQKSFQEAQKQEKAARRGEKTAESAAQNARSNLNATRENLQASREQLQTANESYKAANEDYRITLIKRKNAEASVNRASGAFLRISDQILTLDKQRNELQRQVAELGRATEYFAGGEVQIRVNQTFGARLIAPNQTPQAIAATARALYEQAQRDFRREQQASASSVPEARLQLLPRPERTGENIVFFEGEQIFQRLARDIAAQNGPTSVRLVAVRNFLAGETEIAVHFITVPVAVAFGAGEPLASLIIDGAAGDARIFNQLYTVLIEMGRKAAEKRGVNPPQSPDEPNFYALGTNVALFEALRRIEASKSPQRVTLVAAEELSTVEPLRVRFEVSSVAPSS